MVPALLIPDTKHCFTQKLTCMDTVLQLNVLYWKKYIYWNMYVLSIMTHHLWLWCL